MINTLDESLELVENLEPEDQRYIIEHVVEALLSTGDEETALRYGYGSLGVSSNVEIERKSPAQLYKEQRRKYSHQNRP